jgi:hypothetical protein
VVIDCRAFEGPVSFKQAVGNNGRRIVEIVNSATGINRYILKKSAIDNGRGCIGVIHACAPAGRSGNNGKTVQNCGIVQVIVIVIYYPVAIAP